LLAEQGVLPLRFTAFGDVVMGSHPVFAARNRAIDDRDGAPVFKLGHEGLALSGGRKRHQFGAVLLGIALQAAGFKSITDDVGKARAGPDQLRRQPVDFQISFVVDDETVGAVEHNDALRHIVQRDVQEAALVDEPASSPSPAAAEQSGRAETGKKRDRRAGNEPPWVRNGQISRDCKHRASRWLAAVTGFLLGNSHPFTYT
jgi:hypothetical protein